MCPSAGCQVGTAVQLVDPTLHGTLGGWRASAENGPASQMPPRPHNSQNVIRRLGGLLAIRPPGDVVQLLKVDAGGVSIHASLPCVRVEQTLAA